MSHLTLNNNDFKNPLQTIINFCKLSLLKHLEKFSGTSCLFRSFQLTFPAFLSFLRELPLNTERQLKLKMLHGAWPLIMDFSGITELLHVRNPNFSRTRHHEWWINPEPLPQHSKELSLYCFLIYPFNAYNKRANDHNMRGMPKKPFLRSWRPFQLPDINTKTINTKTITLEQCVWQKTRLILKGGHPVRGREKKKSTRKWWKLISSQRETHNPGDSVWKTENSYKIFLGKGWDQNN